MKPIKSGDKVKINMNLDKTNEKYGLDDDGEMLSMCGKVCIASEDQSSSSIEIYNEDKSWFYTFCLKDVKRVCKPLSQPKPILFNIKNLIWEKNK